MIIVTGTKRSGTSMWMQILIAAGFEPFGDAFPRKWGETIRDANPDGFYESVLREGIYWRTNPHPTSGAYFFPEQVERHVVKVFIPGVVRTDRAYIGSVIATMRPWREYAASLDRLLKLEQEAHADKPNRPKPPPRMPPALEWWQQNFMLVRDIVVRRHRVHVQSYDGLLDDPDKTIHETIAWLGHGDAAAAVAAVKPGNRTQRSADIGGSEGVSADVAARFDELYDAVHRRLPMTAAFVTGLNELHAKLVPQIREHAQAIQRESRRRRAAQMQARAEAGHASDEPPIDSDAAMLEPDAAMLEPE
jgi:hypothetical protein